MVILWSGVEDLSLIGDQIEKPREIAECHDSKITFLRNPRNVAESHDQKITRKKVLTKASALGRDR